MQHRLYEPSPEVVRHVRPPCDSIVTDEPKKSSTWSRSQEGGRHPIRAANEVRSPGRRSCFYYPVAKRPHEVNEIIWERNRDRYEQGHRPVVSHPLPSRSRLFSAGATTAFSTVMVRSRSATQAELAAPWMNPCRGRRLARVLNNLGRHGYQRRDLKERAITTSRTTSHDRLVTTSPRTQVSHRSAPPSATSTASGGVVGRGKTMNEPHLTENEVALTPVRQAGR